jgi:hypothetical protein
MGAFKTTVVLLLLSLITPGLHIDSDSRSILSNELELVGVIRGTGTGRTGWCSLVADLELGRVTVESFQSFFFFFEYRSTNR